MSGLSVTEGEATAPGTSGVWEPESAGPGVLRDQDTVLGRCLRQWRPELWLLPFPLLVSSHPRLQGSQGQTPASHQKAPGPPPHTHTPLGPRPLEGPEARSLEPQSVAQAQREFHAFGLSFRKGVSDAYFGRRHVPCCLLQCFPADRPPELGPHAPGVQASLALPASGSEDGRLLTGRRRENERERPREGQANGG